MNQNNNLDKLDKALDLIIKKDREAIELELGNLINQNDMQSMMLTKKESLMSGLDNDQPLYF